MAGGRPLGRAPDPLTSRCGGDQRPARVGAASAGSGSRTWNDAPPPGRSWTQARPPCSSAKRATRERPMPTPGAWAAALGPWRKGSNRAARSSCGTPPPASSTVRRTPSRWRATLTHTGVSGVVWRPALVSRFSTTRSTLAGSTQATTGSTARSSRRPLRSCHSRAIRLTSAARSVRLRSGVRMPLLRRSRSSRSERSRSSLPAFATSRSTSRRRPPRPDSRRPA